MTVLPIMSNWRNEKIKIEEEKTMSNRCCSCGINIPEGYQICTSCFKRNDLLESFIQEIRKNQKHKTPKRRRKQREVFYAKKT